MDTTEEYLYLQTLYVFRRKRNQHRKIFFPTILTCAAISALSLLPVNINTTFVSGTLRALKCEHNFILLNSRDLFDLIFWHLLYRNKGNVNCQKFSLICKLTPLSASSFRQEISCICWYFLIPSASQPSGFSVARKLTGRIMDLDISLYKNNKHNSLNLILTFYFIRNFYYKM